MHPLLTPLPNSKRAFYMDIRPRKHSKIVPWSNHILIFHFSPLFANLWFLRADLGRSSWKLLHTMMAKFPDEPTEEESQALSSFIHLFTRLYPCGECARHFQEIIEKYPPQVATRSTAAVWACHVHNQVNKSLKKELFDCSKIGEFYDCGCSIEGL